MTKLIEQLINKHFKGSSEKDETGPTNKNLRKLKSYLQKPVTPDQEVFTLVLIHVFYPQVAYECFGVKDHDELGAYLDSLPSDETYLDKFDLSTVRMLNCSTNE